MRLRTLCILAIVLAVLAAAILLPAMTSVRPVAYGFTLSDIKFIRELDPHRIIVVDLTLGAHQSIQLFPGSDDKDLNRLLTSLKNVNFVRPGFFHRVDACDRITVMFRQGNSMDFITFRGSFVPSSAPIIGETTRSDDLAKIIYDIFRWKGLEPRVRKTR